MHIISKIKDPSWWIENSLTDLFFFCRNVLCTLEDPTPGYKDLYAPTHKKLCSFVEKWTIPGHKLLILLPRGWIKSYIITIGWLTQRFLQNFAARRYEGWSLCSAVIENSDEFLEKWQFNWTDNDLMRGLFKQYIPYDLKAGSKTWTQKAVDLHGNRIKLGSVEKSLTSKHFHGGIINDDIVNVENARTPGGLAGTIDWWKHSWSLLMPMAIMFNIGTRYDMSDVYGHIIEKFFKISDKEWEKLMERPSFECHAGRFHYLHFQCWDDPLNERGSTYPILYPEERLKEIFLAQAEIAGGQYLNDPLSQQKRKINPDWLKKRWKEGDIPKVVNTIMTIDPAESEKETSDFSGMTVVDAGSDKKIYVKYADRRHVTDLNLVEWIVEVAPIFQPGQIGIEENKFDTIVELLRLHIPQLMRMEGRIPPAHVEYVKIIPNICVPLKHRGRPKPVRIDNLTGYLQSGMMLLAIDGMEKLREEMLRYPKGRWDDILDALAYILDLLVFPNPADPEKSLILPDEMKKTPQEREKEDWDQYLDEVEAMKEWTPQMLEDLEDEF